MTKHRVTSGLASRMAKAKGYWFLARLILWGNGLDYWVAGKFATP